jgi:CheY-like chemotaxis protein
MGEKVAQDAMPRILIVDDDDAIRETLREALEDEGYEVAEASNGLDALEKLRASREGMVVLLDHLMPKLDGIGMLRVIQADPLLASRHAYILLTARARMTMPVRELSTALAVSVVRKPFDLEVLFQTIGQAAKRLGAAH